MALPPEVEASYTTIIDSILAASDLNTISEKRIRKGLEAAVKDDLTPQKHLIKRLIMARFDKFHAETSAAPSSPAESPAGSVTNGHGVEDGSLSDPVSNMKPSLAAAGARGKLEAEDDEWERGEAPSMVVAAPPKPPKKKRKLEDEDEDARLAAMLQAEEDRRARKTRGAASRKPVPVKKRKTSSSKAKSTTKGEDDSSAVSESEEKKKRKVNKNGGFHKKLTLSAPLAQFLGETALSRPETVKRLWAYFKEHQLQDPKDRRQIRCDDALKAVFRQDRVHMFTMNKLLSDHLFTPDE